MKKIIIILIIWTISILGVSFWTFENPEKFEKFKNILKNEKETKIKRAKNPDGTNVIKEYCQSYKKGDFIECKITANAFTLKLKKILSLSEKTAFIENSSDSKKFKSENLKIFTQNGNVYTNLKATKLNLPNHFTLDRNGGVKNIISIEDYKLALISSNIKDCYFASIILLNTGKEIFKTKCLPEIAKNNDFNGLGSSNIHYKNKILFSLGTPEKHASKNSKLAQDVNSFFGKILSIDKEELITSIKKQENLNINIFSIGHRVPQGITLMNNKIFSVEHGPKGGDELNLIEENNNYGWPNVSYGTNYLKEGGGDGSAYFLSHENDNYDEPLFAFVPSVGISSLNNCPKKLKNYYKKPCLMALSLYGNTLRKGYSMIIFLLNEEMDKVHSIEKISTGKLVLRHFVTNKFNELYEDADGSIYISADKKGIYKFSFEEFR
ncbi:PQQ-dependent sugar dehydrogenase [Pelagibacteraceae bacterium]|jgi:uncharacterized protein YxeA|nr:PQQ-dependent sugar dehydrogenase [Pelagibacteraceae bacterium]